MEGKVKTPLFSLIPGRDLVFKESTGSGPGGQHRNRTKSTITLTHPESGVTVKAGDEKSQHRNKRTALRRLIVNRKFKNWVRVKAAMIEQGYRNVEEKVDALMKKENLKIEYIAKFTCDGCGKQRKTLSPNRSDRSLPPGMERDRRENPPVQNMSDEDLKVAFVGSRSFSLIPLVYQAMKKIGRCTVISGGARGVDQAAEDASDALGYPKKIMKADWGSYGKAAGPRRNYEMVQEVDVAMVFWDGKSRGTRDFMNKAMHKGIPMFCFETTDGPQKITVTKYKTEALDAKRQFEL